MKTVSNLILLTTRDYIRDYSCVCVYYIEIIVWVLFCVLFKKKKSGIEVECKNVTEFI